MHDFFLERDYPAPTELARVAALLTDDYQMPDLLRQRLQMDAETFDKAVEKLIAQGAAAIDIAGNVRATEDAPDKPHGAAGYDEQIAFRRSQIDRMVQFAETPQCRMAALIQHFGDTADGLRPCGHCDFCSPQNATAQTFRPPTTEEDRQLRAILRALDGTTRATGKLHTELSTSALRNTPPQTAKSSTPSSTPSPAPASSPSPPTLHQPRRQLITFKKASLTHEGRTRTGPLPPDLLLKDQPPTMQPFIATKIHATPPTQSPPKASLKAEREQTTAAYTADRNPSKHVSATGAKPKPQRPANPPSSSSPTPSFTTIVIARPDHHLRTPHSLRHRPRKSRPLRRRHHRALPLRRIADLRFTTESAKLCIHSQIICPDASITYQAAPQSRHLDRS